MTCNADFLPRRLVPRSSRPASPTIGPRNISTWSSSDRNGIVLLREVTEPARDVGRTSSPDSPPSDPDPTSSQQRSQ
ncbi:hypothetical protein DACRYDRAFT_95221 [Dacryopinax primogenitus]|uniref:Uncharacterized protein n=1 Tax=Dacryopinax primogenitus (strain DJM 731) TaxID=1858805 RepID=M5FWX6_DACPD|nr:uncharacterized protein DACRYDRAFT_95221 [Dacryopinax primogenitus]EJU00924.1 hypothetical protein DACRYDRAFT_95221 [Dacryopinax primogenitus]